MISVKMILITQVTLWLFTLIASVINIKYVKNLKVDLIILTSILVLNILWGNIVMPYLITKVLENKFHYSIDTINTRVE